MVDGVLDFLLDGLCFEDFVKILDAEVAAGTEGIGGVVGPGVGVDTPARSAPFAVEALFEVEASYEDDFPAGFGESGDAWGCEPFVDVAGVVVSHYAA